ncbi:MAG: KH domain RNA binding protein YlqC [uncultured Acidimicrobiales bacterium]|uniref:RNA-binding protein KhpA n=1 Tax=uncultured Acidimicrobiales bacterium TaxID=310071 RepID=A0A6J4IJV5_9ACTN|nr:MAG: KH domain RNA binding protein YlqC [uncultured Acidimicrobiales bacterium]
MSDDVVEGVADELDDDEAPAPTAEDVLAYLVESLVDDPDSVEIDSVEGRRGVSLEVRVAAGDMGRVIGRRGRMANAIRTVVRAAAVKDGVATDVDFVD